MEPSDARLVQEWIGATPDTQPPPRVQLRVFKRFDGICPKCTRKLQPGEWACDHIIAIINGGKNCESNLQPLCVSPCHSKKTREDVAEKSRVYRKATAHAGIKLKKSRPFPGSRRSNWKRKVDGTVVRREPD
jgi:5-methylcytosine-specific restriction protein A